MNLVFALYFFAIGTFALVTLLNFILLLILERNIKEKIDWLSFKYELFLKKLNSTYDFNEKRGF